MTDKYNMTGHKLLWHLDRLSGWQKGKRIEPLHIDLGITTACNLACSYCYASVTGHADHSERFDMPLDMIMELFLDCKTNGVRSIALTGEGENTLNPAIYVALGYAEEIKLDVGLATNGVHFHEEDLHGMLKALTFIRFNLSAANAGSYKRIHGKESFSDVVTNILRCVSLKRDNNLPVAIGMQMLVIDDNIGDILPMAHMAKEFGVDYLVLKPVSIAPGSEFPQLTTHCTGALKFIESLSDDKFTVVVKWGKFATNKHNFKVCHGTEFMIAINSRGMVAPCGHLFSAKYKDEFVMGNIFETPLFHIVNSDKYWDIQKKVQELDVDKDCETHCKQSYICEFLEKLKRQPEHINFV